MQHESALCKLRGKLHTEIRREQLQLKFNAHRQQLLVQIDSRSTPLELQILMDNLQVVKRAIEWPKESHSLIKSLQKLQELLTYCNATNCLLKAVELDSGCERAKTNASLKYTWMDLLLTMLQQNWEEPVLQTCASLLSLVAIGLKTTMQKELINTWYLQQHMRMLVNYPYGKLKDPNCKIVLKSLNFLYEIVISCNDAKGLYYLLNNTTPDILQLLLSVKSAPNFQEVQKDYIFTSTSVLFLVNQFDFSNLHAAKYQQLLAFVSSYLVNSILNCNDPELFQRQGKLIESLCEQRSPWLQPAQFESLQQLYTRQPFRDHLRFFQMMRRIIYHFTYQLAPNTVQLLLQKLLHMQGQISPQRQGPFYHSIVATLQSHIHNCGNRLPPQDQYTFVTLLKTKSKQLGILARFLEKHNYLTFQSLLKVMSQLIADDMVLGCELLENQLRPLLEYEEFKALLHEYNICTETAEQNQL